MCWAEHCCYFVPLRSASIILGVVNFVISLSLTIVSIVFYFSKTKMVDTLTSKPERFIAPSLGLDLKMETLNIILSVVAIVCLFWMIFSILLVLGVVKNEPSLVLSYFSFGIILTIIGQLSGLLMLINHFWWTAIAIFVASLINIHFLVVIHTVYDLMQKGTYFGSQREQDQDPLADCFDENLTGY